MTLTKITSKTSKERTVLLDVKNTEKWRVKVRNPNVPLTKAEKNTKDFTLS